MSTLSSIGPTLPAYDLLSPGRVGGPDLAAGARMPLEGPGEAAVATPAGSTFASMFGRMVAEVNAKQSVAADTVNALQSGENVSLHQAMIAMEEASVSFQLMVEVRNKLLESYQELMRLQV